jgi:hypothetical protein
MHCLLWFEKSHRTNEGTIRGVQFRFDSVVPYPIEYIEIRKSLKGFGSMAN